MALNAAKGISRRRHYYQFLGGTDDRPADRQTDHAFWADRPGLMLLPMFMSLLFDLLLSGSALLTRIDLHRVS